VQRPCRLQAEHDVSAFDCGDELLDRFLKHRAWQDQLNKSIFTFVATEDNRVVAYYSLAVASILPEEAFLPIVAGSGKRDITVLRITRLAVDKKKQKQRTGSSILKDALARACVIAHGTGIRCIIADAKNECAEKFYRHYNFEPWPIDTFRLYLLMKDIRKTLA
jgi:GNAT superfamily N-acetyltransferase